MRQDGVKRKGKENNRILQDLLDDSLSTKTACTHATTHKRRQHSMAVSIAPWQDSIAHRAVHPFQPESTHQSTEQTDHPMSIQDQPMGRPIQPKSKHRWLHRGHPGKRLYCHHRCCCHYLVGLTARRQVVVFLVVVAYNNDYESVVP